MGLDLHKNYIHGYVFQPGQKGTHFRFSNTPDEWAQFVATRLTPETAVAIEATGNAFTIYDRLIRHARQVVVIHPALKGLGAGRHTDRIDQVIKIIMANGPERMWGHMEQATNYVFNNNAG
ncbi:hypothetical protein TPY_2098 [Sulfobacillus acidophilus TPY]|nr:hypothetical protein TPY_2098 [Sulfobacillus acidophilus TPY]